MYAIYIQAPANLLHNDDYVIIVTYEIKFDLKWCRYHDVILEMDFWIMYPVLNILHQTEQVGKKSLVDNGGRIPFIFHQSTG